MPSLSELVTTAAAEQKNPAQYADGLRPRMEHLLRESQVKRELTRLQIAEFLRDEDPLDEDGYPTQRTLWAIEHWPFDDQSGWFAFLRTVWHLADWGWHEADESPKDPHAKEAAPVHRWHLSTAGWSGNESLVAAMRANEMLWHSSWAQSRRGGHYIFEREYIEAEEPVTSAWMPTYRSIIDEVQNGL